MDLATQKGASNWLTVLPMRDMDFDVNKSEFRDAVKLRHDWEVPDIPSVCVCGDIFSVDHAMIAPSYSRSLAHKDMKKEMRQWHKLERQN